MDGSRETKDVTTIEALTSETGSGATYYAVRRQDVGTCEALGWAWVSIRPFILASGPAQDTVAQEATQRAGHDAWVMRSTEPTVTISPDEHRNDMGPSCANASGDHDWDGAVCRRCGCTRAVGWGRTTYAEPIDDGGWERPPLWTSGLACSKCGKTGPELDSTGYVGNGLTATCLGCAL